jgi:iron(III) transport system substrate-binding protein
VFNVLTTMGEEKGRAYLQHLAAQQPVSVAVSPRAVLDQVISGEHWIGLMMYNHNAAASIGAGAPLANARVEPLVALFNIIGVIEGSPHPNAGKLLVEYILSDEGQSVMQRQDYLPADPNIPARIPELKPEGGHFAVTAMTPEIAKEGLTKWISVYREVFR